MALSKDLAREVVSLLPPRQSLWLIGSHKVTIDEKGRFPVPAAMQSQMVEDMDQSFVLEFNQTEKGKYLLLQPHSQRAPFFDVLALLKESDKYNKEICILLSSVTLVKPDKDSRILIPSYFRDKLELNLQKNTIAYIVFDYIIKYI